MFLMSFRLSVVRTVTILFGLGLGVLNPRPRIGIVICLFDLLYLLLLWRPAHPRSYHLPLPHSWRAAHSDSHTPYEVLLNKFLWPMCWSFGISLEWGSGLKTSKFTAPLENLVLSWVRRVVVDDCVEILCVGFSTTHAKLEIFLAFTTWK